MVHLLLPLQCSSRGVSLVTGFAEAALAVLQFTNMGQGFQGTLDYVLYTTNSLVPTATLELPDESDIKDTRNSKSGLPNETWSSDHIALLAEFQYKQT